MPTDVIMPQMGESIFEGTITKWLKKPGDPVERDEPLFEISTDKVDAEIPSPVAGVLSEIRIAEGTTVQVNTVVAVVADSGEAVAAASAPPAAQPEPAVATQPSSPTVRPAQSSSAGVDVVMPQMGESIIEGTITRWLKQVGDKVEKDEPLFEISTDKVDAEIPAPTAGVLSEIKVPAGATVEINTVVAVIGGSAAGKNETAAAAPEPASPSSFPAPEPPPLAPGQRLRSSPLVRKMAAEHKIDLRLIQGSGSEGRITKADVLHYLSNPAAAQSATPTVPPGALLAPSAPPQVAQGAQVVAMTRMRAIIAQRMAESKRIAPHVHVVYKVDMTRIVRLRQRERDGFERRHGVKLTYMPFIAAAAIQALQKFPIVNASLVGESIHYHPGIHLGIAVALEWGLIVPVVRQAEQRTFTDLARIIADLAGRARGKKLRPDEVGGSTFTLTNSGIFGDEFATPIINQPESGILAIGSLRKEPVVLTDREGDDTIAIRSMQYFTLGFDHRLIDGADSGKFMSELKQTLEGWDREIG